MKKITFEAAVDEMEKYLEAMELSDIVELYWERFERENYPDITVYDKDRLRQMYSQWPYDEDDFEADVAYGEELGTVDMDDDFFFFQDEVMYSFHDLSVDHCPINAYDMAYKMVKSELDYVGYRELQSYYGEAVEKARELADMVEN